LLISEDKWPIIQSSERGQEMRDADAADKRLSVAKQKGGVVVKRSPAVKKQPRPSKEDSGMAEEDGGSIAQSLSVDQVPDVAGPSRRREGSGPTDPSKLRVDSFSDSVGFHRSYPNLIELERRVQELERTPVSLAALINDLRSMLTGQERDIQDLEQMLKFRGYAINYLLRSLEEDPRNFLDVFGSTAPSSEGEGSEDGDVVEGSDAGSDRGQEVASGVDEEEFQNVRS
jgi:hypothetical protein